MRRSHLGLLVLAAITAVAGVTGPNAAAATRAGTATLITPDDGRVGAGQVLSGGNTTTPFSLKLPTSASCRGDSANDGYRVQTYMVPEGVDPAALTFGSVGPLPTATGAAFREPLFATTSDPVVNNQTAAATKPPGPGPIINIPAMNFAVYRVGDIPPGTYNVGVACTRGQASGSQLDTFWNAQISVSAGLGGSEPGPLWKVVNTSAAPATGAQSHRVAAGPEVSARGPKATSAAGDPSSAVREAPKGAGRTSSTAHQDPAPSGAPPSFHLPVMQLLPHVRLTGAWMTVLVGAVLFALVGSSVRSFIVRRTRSGVGHAWPIPGRLSTVPQEGR